MDNDKNAVQYIAALGAAQRFEPTWVSGVPMLMVPDGYKLEKFTELADPVHLKQSVRLATLQSFIDYINEFKTQEMALFVNSSDNALSMVSVLDYHRPDKASRCAHKAYFEAQLTPEWNALKAINRQYLPQEKFANWLEDNMHLCLKPSGAALLELVTNLTGKLDVSFTSIQRRADNTSDVSYEEDLQLKGSGSAGTVKVPQTLTLAVPPFIGESPYEIQARLKLKLEARKLHFAVEVVRPEIVIRDAAKIMVEKLESELDYDADCVPIYMGAPMS